MFCTGFDKIARELTTKGRKKIKEENFALPGRRYPIHDISHARNALARIAQHGTPEEQRKVRAAVIKKHPRFFEKTAFVNKEAGISHQFGGFLNKAVKNVSPSFNSTLTKAERTAQNYSDFRKGQGKANQVGGVAANAKFLRQQKKARAKGKKLNSAELNQMEETIKKEKALESAQRFDRMRGAQPFYKRHPYLTMGGAYLGAKHLLGSGQQQPPTPPPPQVVQY